MELVGTVVMVVVLDKSGEGNTARPVALCISGTFILLSDVTGRF